MIVIIFIIYFYFVLISESIKKILKICSPHLMDQFCNTTDEFCNICRHFMYKFSSIQ